jgi:hypothetical protein
MHGKSLPFSYDRCVPERPSLTLEQHAAARIFIARLATLSERPPTAFESRQIGMRWLPGTLHLPVAETDTGVQMSAADFVLAGVEVAWRLMNEIRDEQRAELIQRVGLALTLELPDESLDGAADES